MSYEDDTDSVSASDAEAGPVGAQPGPENAPRAAPGGPGGHPEGLKHEGGGTQGGLPLPGPAAAAAAAAADREAEAALLAGELSRDAALLQLQVNDLLASVRPPPLKPAVLADVLAQLRAALAAIKPQEVPGVRLHGLIAGLGLDPAGVSLPFEPPAAVQAVGSVPLGAALRSARPVLDVAVVMPEGCLHRKDHVNYKYHARRALYLATLARGLANQPAFAQQTLEALHGDAARPVLLVHLASPALTLRVMPVPPAGAFPLHKLAPDRNNVRWVTRAGPAAGGAAQQPAQQQPAQQQPAQQQQQEQEQQRQGEEGGKPHAGPSGQPSEWLATPAYNAAIAEDATAVAASAALAARLQASAPLRDALLLLKVWAVGAGLAAASGGAGPDDARPAASALGMSGHLLAAVLLCAAEAAGPPAASMSSFQLFRAALGLLADAAAWSTGLAVGRAHGKGGQQQKQQQQQNGASEGQGPPLPAVFRKAYPVVLLDATGWTNLAAGVPQSLLAQAQLLARRTLAELDHPADAEAAFAAAFLARLRPAALFDYLWAVTLPEPEGGALPPRGDVSQARQDEALVEGLVRKALTSRARLVRALPRTPTFPTTAASGVLGALAAGASVPASSPLLVGAVVDAAEALRAVDVGPPADDTAAAARFRALWGERSELRRFQDGRICEAVVWDAPGDARHTVPDAAVAALLRRHLPEGARVSCSASRLDGALDAAAPAGGAIAPLGAVAAGRAAESALDKLARQLRGLGEVVLKVVGVQPLSPVSRRTAAFVPEPHPLVGGPGGLAAAAGAANLPRCLDPLEVMVSLEGSGRWPDDPAAYAKMKAAVGCQLATALAAAAGFTVSPSEEAVDVFVDGFAFRLFLFTDRDAAMHAKVLAAGPHAHHHHAEAHSPPRALLLSWHHGLAAGLEGQHAAYGPTCRLAKRWLGCQLMGSQLGEEAVELLVGAAFCGPAAAPPPASRITGLLRFLQLLATHPWQRAPLLVDPEREVGEGARRALLAEYDARRAAGTAPAMFISTPRDLHSSRWTMDRPGPGVVAHLAATAAAAAELLARLQERDGAAAWGALFEAPLPDFDAWLLLRRDALPSANRALPGAASRLLKYLDRAAPASSGKRGRGSSSSATDVPAAKAARAVLRAFPARVLASQPTASLVPELLVGFEPVRRYVAELTERYGHIADFCADPAGGFPAVGVRWRPAAFVPSPLRPATAHAVVEVAPGLVLPNLPQALAEMEQLGQGLVARAVAL